MDSATYMTPSMPPIANLTDMESVRKFQADSIAILDLFASKQVERSRIEMYADMQMMEMWLWEEQEMRREAAIRRLKRVAVGG